MIAMMWYNADQPNPCEGLDPIDFGWCKVEKSFTPNWYEGAPIPAAVDLRMRNDAEMMEDSDDEDEDIPGEAEAESSDSSGDEELNYIANESLQIKAHFPKLTI